MKFLKEILSQYTQPDDELSSDQDTDNMLSDDDLQQDDQGVDDDSLPSEDDQELDQVASKATEDPDKRGLIRTVKGAHLVYKRETEDGTFEELWVYNSGDNMRDELKTRRAILSGTDIPVDKTSSSDGKQGYSMWTIGNVEMLNIKGLPN